MMYRRQMRFSSFHRVNNVVVPFSSQVVSEWSMETGAEIWQNYFSRNRSTRLNLLFHSKYYFKENNSFITKLLAVNKIYKKKNHALMTHLKKPISHRRNGNKRIMLNINI